MIISHKHKFIFIKPRKVAGTSVEVNLSKHCGKEDIITPTTEYTNKNDEDAYEINPQNERDFKQHSKPDFIKKKIGDSIWKKYYKITIVRNPWSMLVSRYEWENSTLDRLSSDKPLANVKKKALLKPKTYLKILKLIGIKLGIIDNNKDFKRFIENLPENLLNTDYYFDSQGNPLADYYIRFENLNQDYKKLCDILKLPYEELPRLKTKSRKKRKNYKKYYDKKTKYIVAKKAEKEISFFNYNFE